MNCIECEWLKQTDNGPRCSRPFGFKCSTIDTFNAIVSAQIKKCDSCEWHKKSCNTCKGFCLLLTRDMNLFEWLTSGKLCPKPKVDEIVPIKSPIVVMTPVNTSTDEIVPIQNPRLKPTLPQMAEHFTKAMVKWTASGFKTVTKEEYERRRLICNECSGGWLCPKCGCALWAKSALETEKCEKWEI